MGFGPLLCTDKRGRMSERRAGYSGEVAGCPGWRVELLWFLVRGARFPGLWPDFRAEAGCPGWTPDVRALETWQTWLLLMEKLQGPDVRGLGRMSGAWKVSLSVSAGSLHPWSGQLVHLHMRPREVLLDT